MTEDDDLPVLTHILRTGTPSIGAAPPAVPDIAQEAPVDEPMMADQLVIGHEPHGPVDGYLDLAEVEPYAAPADNGHAANADLEHDHAHAVDAFRLPQDHEGGRGSSATMNEPEFASRVEATLEAPVEATLAAPVDDRPREDAAAFASRVRDAVLDDLGSRIDTELDARMAQAIHAEVESAVAQLQRRLRSHLTEALRDVVQRAVDEEIVRLGMRPSDGA